MSSTHIHTNPAYTLHTTAALLSSGMWSTFSSEGERAHPLKCVYSRQKGRERERERMRQWKKKKKKKAGPGNPADSQASKSLPPSPLHHLVSMSLEFKPKWKEIVSCWHQGSSVAFFPCLRFRRKRSAIYKQYTWSYSPANQSHNSLVVSTSVRSRLHSLTLAN